MNNRRPINPEAPFDGGDPERHWLDGPPPPNRSWIVSIVLALGVAVMVCGLLVYAFAAGAHMEHRPDLNDWFKGLKNNRGMTSFPCCSKNDEADGNLVPVEEYVTKEEFGAHNCRRTTNDTNGDAKGPFEFCAHIYDQWWLVPEKTVLRESNKYGEALAFLVWSWDRDQKVVSFFRCFLPGAGT